MRRGLTLILAAAQVCALALATVGAAPAGSAARWHGTGTARGTSAAQPREMRGRSVYAVAAQNWLWPRTSSPRGTTAPRQAARLAQVPLPSRPGWVPAIPPVLRI